MRWKFWINIWRARIMNFEPIMNPDMTPFGPWRWHQLAELVLCDKTRSWPQFSGQRKEVRRLTTSNYDPFEWQRHAIKRPPNMQAIFTSSQTRTLSNSVNGVNSANSVARCYLHLWRYFFALFVDPLTYCCSSSPRCCHQGNYFSSAHCKSPEAHLIRRKTDIGR